MERFTKLYSNGLEYEKRYEYANALPFYKKAFEIKNWSEKLKEKITMLSSKPDKDGFIYNPMKHYYKYKEIKLKEDLYNKLYIIKYI